MDLKVKEISTSPFGFSATKQKADIERIMEQKGGGKRAKQLRQRHICRLKDQMHKYCSKLEQPIYLGDHTYTAVSRVSDDEIRLYSANFKETVTIKITEAYNIDGCGIVKTDKYQILPLPLSLIPTVEAKEIELKDLAASKWESPTQKALFAVINHQLQTFGCTTDLRYFIPTFNPHAFMATVNDNISDGSDPSKRVTVTTPTIQDRKIRRGSLQYLRENHFDIHEVKPKIELIELLETVQKTFSTAGKNFTNLTVHKQGTANLRMHRDHTKLTTITTLIKENTEGHHLLCLQGEKKPAGAPIVDYHYNKSDVKQILMDPYTILMFPDEKVYHGVSPLTKKAPNAEMNRTVLIFALKKDT